MTLLMKLLTGLLETLGDPDGEIKDTLNSLLLMVLESVDLKKNPVTLTDKNFYTLN